MNETEPHSHECPECQDSWKHSDPTCPYPRYTWWDDEGTSSGVGYILPEFPCPNHQWSDMPQVGYSA